MRRAAAISVGAVGVLLVVAAPAAAATPAALLDFPSVKEIVQDVVKFFFSSFLDALVPDWLRDGSVDLIRRLVTVPDPTDRKVWPTLATLSEGVRWIAIPLLSLASVASWTQQWLQQFAGRAVAFEQALTRTALAAILLVAYPTFIGNAVALTNSVSAALLSSPAAAEGLERMVGLVFAGSLLSGNGLLLALLGIAAVVLAVGLLMMSVGLLVLFALLYVSAPLAIVSSVVDETHGIWAAWRYTLLSAALVPVGWCVLFTTAGAFTADMTRWSAGVSGELGAQFVGVLAAIVILLLAVRWPLLLWSGIKGRIAGALATVGPAARVEIGGSAAVRGGARVARAALVRAATRPATQLATAAAGVQPAFAMAGARRSVSTTGRTAEGAPAGAGARQREWPARDGTAAQRDTSRATTTSVEGAPAGAAPRSRAASPSSSAAAPNVPGPGEARAQATPAGAGGTNRRQPDSSERPPTRAASPTSRRALRPAQTSRSDRTPPPPAAGDDRRLAGRAATPSRATATPSAAPWAQGPIPHKAGGAGAKPSPRAAGAARRGAGAVGPVWRPPPAPRDPAPISSAPPGAARPMQSPTPASSRGPVAPSAAAPANVPSRDPRPPSPVPPAPRSAPVRRVRRKWREG
ncbi:hypothetical protein Q5424_04800 [Conexibacter sp. JD483]|uniref:hypothetical protein n=1 Tax=unclassified Conexibacter TaxID=2627773 RepID=UPI00271AF38B|nr:MULTISPECIES: hypothetical protein [unclassified Conexibacter]MDO8184651.1 hypothetical protein [Conexibacter sp. CPCC 205706]MDO8197957.1 hypothetical protein [Conexibacter sp. CPCC 205762]MDR9368387.1 hypothetical protein [Conexibacter sp. JD483]